MKRKDAGAMPVQQEPLAVPNTPVTVAGWQSRIGELHDELAAVERALVEKAAARRQAAGKLLLGIGGTLEAVELLEREEDGLQHQVDGLHAAIELGEHEVRRLQNAERKARIEAQRQRRQAVAAAILEHAHHVDGAFGQAADHLRAIDALLVEYRQASGMFMRSLKGCTTRAIKANPALREFVLTEFVGGHEHLRPLAEQLGALAVAPGADERFEGGVALA